ncbi:hypothetical protein PR202_gb14309 [Eleusine coracana subsp. coracana]|uniref:Uncharacterized protein n=1 Tax=Eleusine coracana subsp. coracana TaxID=191504 RepID=A0AAV5EV21_ELECO|nr:hypothetical protein PR202_gb14309 [Eleusine coracana subsp. coracana]
MARPRKAKPPPPPRRPRRRRRPSARRFCWLRYAWWACPSRCRSATDPPTPASCTPPASTPDTVGASPRLASLSLFLTSNCDPLIGPFAGVVLKKARKIANGKGHGSVPIGAFVDTLVVQPNDLVQVIAKDLSLPIKGLCPSPECNVVAEGGSMKPQVAHANEPKLSKSENLSLPKPVQQGNTACQKSDTYLRKNAQTCSNAMGGSSSTRHVGPCSAPLVTLDVKSPQVASNSATKVVTSSRASVKQFKLNPSAKVFSPSFTSSKQVLAAATPVNPNYMSHSTTEVPTGIPVFESKSMRGGSSLSSKVHYNNLSDMNCGISPQYVQSDVMHGAPVISQGWPRPVLLNTYQPKFQGNMPVYMAPPVMATGNMPFVVPSPAPLVQPFQAIHPIMVPAASSMVPGKYM